VYDTNMASNKSDSYNPLRELFNGAIYVAVTTAFLSVMGVLYQAGYYSYFGINPVIAGIPLDTLTITNGSVVPIASAIVAFLGLGAFILYRKAQASDLILTSFLLKVVVLAIAILSIFIVTASEDKNIVTILSAAASALVILINVFAELPNLRKYLKLRKQLLDWDAFFDNSERKMTQNFNYKLLLLAIGATMIMSLSSAHEVARTVAQGQRVFTTIANDSGGNFIEVVVARGEGGLIVKLFDPELDAWEPGYYIAKEDNQTFVMKNISTVR